MDTTQIANLLIVERDRLDEAIAALTNGNVPKKKGRPFGSKNLVAGSPQPQQFPQGPPPPPPPPKISQSEIMKSVWQRRKERKQQAELERAEALTQKSKERATQRAAKKSSAAAPAPAVKGWDDARRKKQAKIMRDRQIQREVEKRVAERTQQPATDSAPTQ